MLKQVLYILSIIAIISLCSCSNIEQPLVQGNKTIIRVPDSLFSSNWGQWLQVEQRIQRAKTQIIVLLWRGRGGRVDLGIRFGEFMRGSHKYIIVQIVGPAMSMHALVPCYASKVVLTPYGFLMFHIRANDGTPDLSSDSQEENTRLMGICMSKGLVNRQDIRNVNTDHEVYIYPNGSREVRLDPRRN